MQKLRDFIPAAITILGGEGLAGMISWLGHTNLGLTLSIASIIIAILLGFIYRFKYGDVNRKNQESLKESLNKQETRRKNIYFATRTMLPIVILLVICVWLSLTSFNITHNPKLSSPQLQNISVSNDEKLLVATSEITYAIQNRGNNSAYNTSSIICYASDVQPNNIQKGLIAVSPNPLKPQDYLIYYLKIRMPFWMDNGGRTVVSPFYYIYYKVGCSNTSSGKSEYEEYWFKFNFNFDKQTIAECKMEEVKLFKSFVYDYYTKLGNNQ